MMMPAALSARPGASPDGPAAPDVAPDDEARWQAVCARDRAGDGQFVFAVATTYIYCRPSCPARRPARAHVRFYADGAAARAAGFRPCQRCRPDEAPRDAAALAHALALLAAAGPAPALADLAAHTGYSAGHIRRLVERATGLTPAAYGRALRRQRAEAALADGGRVIDAVYAAGYGAPSGFYAEARGAAMAPAARARGGAGQLIRWAEAATTLGPLLVAATQKGVCFLAFGAGKAELAARFPAAVLEEGGAGFAALVAKVVAAVEQPGSGEAIPLDVAGTAFQEAVWQALSRIPPGETLSYAELAVAAGFPGAARAVGQANGANRVAVLIPCHRVVRADGALGGYAWGEAIKAELLRRERK